MLRANVQAASLRMKPTRSGRILLSASEEPITELQRSEVKASAENNPEVGAKLSQLADAARMGIRLRTSKSPAFIGLIVSDLKSAKVPGCKLPLVQLECEDDKVGTETQYLCPGGIYPT
jgi:hypothetical protein